MTGQDRAMSRRLIQRNIKAVSFDMGTWTVSSKMMTSELEIDTCLKERSGET